MMHGISEIETDILVIGGGAAGIAAAVSASRNGASVVIVDAPPMLGRELVTGQPIAGAVTLEGENLLGGFAQEFFNSCAKYDGPVSTICDYRTENLLCIDPEAAKLAITELVYGLGITALMYTMVDRAVFDDDGRVHGVIIRNKRGRAFIRAKVTIDASAEGEVLSSLPGAMQDEPESHGAERTARLSFRMSDVKADELMSFVRSAAENFSFFDHPKFAEDKAKSLSRFCDQAEPILTIPRSSPLIAHADSSDALPEFDAIQIAPTSAKRREVSIQAVNVRVPADTPIESASANYAQLHNQIERVITFLRAHVPGFSEAGLAAIASGVQISGGPVAQGDFVLDQAHAEASPDVIAKGAWTVDPAEAGTGKTGTYNIPFGCLSVAGFESVLVAGERISASQNMRTSVGAIGTRMATGQAAGAAAALASQNGGSIRALDIGHLRKRLSADGAVLGTA